MLNSCPDCDKYIRPDAFKCSCGWTKTKFDTVYIQHIDCAIYGCKTSATVRLKKPTGWANFCVDHYARDNVQESIDYCKKHSLDTTEKKIAHYKALFKTPHDPRAWLRNPKSEIAKRWRDEVLKVAPVERQPGEDDDLPMPAIERQSATVDI